MRTRPKAPVADGAPIRRDDFATWSDYQTALAASDVIDDFERLLELPQTLADWIDHEEASVRRWFAAQFYADGPPLETYLARARERARIYYDTTKESARD